MIRVLVVILLSVFIFGCQEVEEIKVETNSAMSTVQPSKTEIEKPKAGLPIDVANLVNKSEAYFEKKIGKPKKKP